MDMSIHYSIKLKDDEESLQNGAREEVDFEAMTKSYVQKCGPKVYMIKKFI